MFVQFFCEKKDQNLEFIERCDKLWKLSLYFFSAARFQWTKGDGSNFLRPELQRYLFISNNGKLYFSEITRDDAGYYRCIVTLAGDGDTPLKITQPPSRTSLPIQVIVQFQRELIKLV